MTQKLITILLSVTMLFPGAAVVDIFVAHEKQMEARRADMYETDPIILVEEPIVELAEGIEREVKPLPFYNATESELEAVAILVYLEAGGESEACQRAVAEVIFNRLASGLWGDTLTDVIYAKNEFEPAEYICESETTDVIREIVQDVYWNGSTLPERIMFFRADHYHMWDGAINEFVIDNTYFSSSRWCEV